MPSNHDGLATIHSRLEAAMVVTVEVSVEANGTRRGWIMSASATRSPKLGHHGISRIVYLIN